MAKILCIEDNQDFVIYLTSLLKDHTLSFATTLNHAFQFVHNGRESFDLILLDVSLPDGNGIKALNQFKDAFHAKNIPIIVLSADNDILNKVAAFGMGADDYIVKPPNSTELKARIEARLRTAQKQTKDTQLIKIGNLIIDSDKMSVQIQLKESLENIDLTPSEFKLLKILSARPGQVYSRDYLIDHVWGISKHITERTVDAHISHLRKKILLSTAKVETVLGAGYKTEVKVNG